MTRSLSTALFSLLFLSLSAQKNDTTEAKPKVEFSGFVDVYFAVNTDGQLGASDLFYNHTRRQEFNVNLALARASYETDKFRANLGLMTGTYAGTSLAHEPAFLQNLWEANVGVKLGKGLWLDAGVFPSHLGFESAISTDNLTLTRSLVAENSPYYLAGANLTYAPNDQWTFLLNVSNGWQVMYNPDGHLGFGTQIQFTPNENWTFNSSTYFNRETSAFYNPLFFHDFYVTLDQDKNHLVGCFDIGMNQHKVTDDIQNWYGLAFIYARDLSEKLSLGLRGEYYTDGTSNLYVPQNIGYASNITSASLNLDVNIQEGVMFRLEGKYLYREEVFAPNILPIAPPRTESYVLVFASLAANF